MREDVSILLLRAKYKLGVESVLEKIEERMRETIVYGRTEPALVEEKDVMAYFRRGEGQDLFVIGNFDRVSRTVQIDDVTSQARVLLDNCGTYEIEDVRITLQPYQALVFAL